MDISTGYSNTLISSLFSCFDWLVCGGLNSPQIQTKNRSVCENGVTGMWGSCTLLVIGYCLCFVSLQSCTGSWRRRSHSGFPKDKKELNDIFSSVDNCTIPLWQHTTNVLSFLLSFHWPPLPRDLRMITNKWWSAHAYYYLTVIILQLTLGVHSRPVSNVTHLKMSLTFRQPRDQKTEALVTRMLVLTILWHTHTY